MPSQPSTKPIADAASGKTETNQKKPPTVLSCWLGSVTAAAIAAVLYLLTSSIGQTFASKPPQSTNMTVLKISAAVRTLVVGLSAMGTGIFAIAALGLFALGVQLLWQNLRQPSEGS